MHYIERECEREAERIKEIESWSGHSLKTQYEMRSNQSQKPFDCGSFSSVSYHEERA